VERKRIRRKPDKDRIVSKRQIAHWARGRAEMTDPLGLREYKTIRVALARLSRDSSSETFLVTARGGDSGRVERAASVTFCVARATRARVSIVNGVLTAMRERGDDDEAWVERLRSLCSELGAEPSDLERLGSCVKEGDP
jgi:hypothetical protein